MCVPELLPDGHRQVFSHPTFTAQRPSLSLQSWIKALPVYTLHPSSSCLFYKYRSCWGSHRGLPPPEGPLRPPGSKACLFLGMFPVFLKDASPAQHCWLPQVWCQCADITLQKLRGPRDAPSLRPLPQPSQGQKVAFWAAVLPQAPASRAWPFLLEERGEVWWTSRQGVVPRRRALCRLTAAFSFSFSAGVLLSKVLR